MSLLILILMSVQCVSAIDDADVNVIGENGDNDILSVPSEEQSYTELKNLIDSAMDNNRDNITLEYNYKHAGAQSSDPSDGIDITKDLTIIGNGAYIDGSDVSSLFNIADGVTVTLKNLTIKNSGKVASSEADCHRAITAGTGTTLNVINCTFDSNKAGEEWQFNDVDWEGSAIYSYGNVNIQNSSFLNNVVHHYGVIFSFGTVTANNSYFYNNKAVNHESSGGGVIYANYVDIIENCTFISNIANAGGSIFVFAGTTKIRNSTFDGKGTEQYSQRYADNGGAILAYFAHEGLEIEDSTFANFTSMSDGGAVFVLNEDSNTVIKNTSFYKNSGAHGGFIYTYGSVTLSDSHSIYGNGRLQYPATANGGAIYAKGDVAVNNTDFGYNSADVAGGAIYSEKNVYFYNSKANGSADTSFGSGDGGFIYAEGNVEVENSTIASIYMKDATQGKYFSGAVFTKKNIIVRNSNFTKINKAVHSIGGAIRALGNAEIYNSNFTHNQAVNYGALYVDGTLDVYDSNFINNTHGNAFAEKRAIVNNTKFINISCDSKSINGLAIGSNSTLNITNSIVNGTYVRSTKYRGMIFSKDNLFVENCTTCNNLAISCEVIYGMVLSTNSNITVNNCNFTNNSFGNINCYGGNIYAGHNAEVYNCHFTDSTVIGDSGNTHGVVVFAEENITFVDSLVEDIHSANSDHGAITGDYVYVHNSTVRNLTGFTAMGVAIHANIANVSDCNFTLVRSKNEADCGGAIYAYDTYAYRNNFTRCHSGVGGAIYSLNYTTAIENIFINNTLIYSSGTAIYTKNGFIEYNVFLDNKNSQHPEWGGTLADIVITDATVDSIERNWWGNNTPFEGEKGKNRVVIGGEYKYPATWVYMRFFVTDPSQPSVGQGVNLTATLEDYYVNSTGDIIPLGHNIAKRTVIYNSTNRDTGAVEGKFSHDTATIINEDTVLYSNNNFAKHLVSATIDYQTLYLNVTQCEINVTKTVDNKTPKVGQIINYTINVTSKDVTDYSDQSQTIVPYKPVDIVITDILDPRLKFISCNDTNYNNLTGEWTIQGFKINNTYLLSLKVKVIGFGNITNWANVTKINNTDLTNPYGGNVTIEVAEPPAYVELVVTKVANVTDVIVGDKIKFTITVENTGTMDATDVRIYDILPNGFKYESSEGSYNPSTRNVTWTIEKIEAGKLATVELNVSAQSVGKINNTAYAYSKENNTVVNGTSDNVTVGPNVELEISKTANVTEAVVGDSIEYTITVKNIM